MEADEREAIVRAAVERMSPNLSEAIVLAYYHRFAYREIADILGIPLGTVKSRLHAAVAQFATHYKAELKAVHVFDPSAWNLPSHYYLASDGVDVDMEKARELGKDNLKKLAESFDLDVETIFTEGDPGHEIIRIAEELNADLIVLGTHGYSGWKRFTIGSVAEFVGRHAPCAD